MDDRMKERKMLERRRALRRKRRQQQIICRMLFSAVAAVLLVAGAVRILSRLGSSNGEPQMDQVEAYGPSGMMKTSYEEPGEQKEAEEPKKPGEICIVLDAGHGGRDPGTLWKDVYEKDINLAIAKKLEQLLKDAGYQVIMTRDEDVSVSLEERVQTAQEKQADVFVSIHQNALEKDNVTSGIEIYCSGKNKRSVDLVEQIHSRLIDKTGAVDKGMKTDSDFYVVDNTTMPSCLIETGFITSTEERERLLDEDYQKKVAQAIADGIMEFLGTTI